MGKPGRRLPLAEVKDRRQQMYELKLMGESIYNIAKRFSITERQVHIDLKKLSDEIRAKTPQIDIAERIQRYDDGIQKRMQKLWLIAADPSSTKDEKVRALEAIRKEEKFRSELQARVGLLPQDPSPLISIESKSDSGPAENKVQINIIAPAGYKMPGAENPPKDQPEGGETVIDVKETTEDHNPN